LSVRRLFLSLLLTFGLLSAQQAAMVHELGHLLGGELAQASGDVSTPGQEAHPLCEKCLAFAQLANLLTPQWHLPDLAPERIRETTACATGTAGQTAPAACSRGPPEFL